MGGRLESNSGQRLLTLGGRTQTVTRALMQHEYRDEPDVRQAWEVLQMHWVSTSPCTIAQRELPALNVLRCRVQLVPPGDSLTRYCASPRTWAQDELLVGTQTHLMEVQKCDDPARIAVSSTHLSLGTSTRTVAANTA